MKVSCQVSEITHNDLLDILDILLCENHFSFGYRKSDWKSIPKEKRIDDCLTDKVADCLLNGFEVCITDLQAEGEVFGNLKHEINDDESVDYFITLEDVKKGLAHPDAMEYVRDIINETGDYWTSYNLIQFIIFGELIYG